MDFMNELSPVPRPVRVETNPRYYDWRETRYHTNDFLGIDTLAKTIRSDLAEAKSDGRLPKSLRTLVSLNRAHHPSLSVTVRGLSSEEVFDEVPASGGTFSMNRGMRPGDEVSTRWVMNRGWAFVLLQVYLIADGYNLSSSQQGDDYPSSRYTLDLYVKDVGTMTDGHLMSIVDAQRWRHSP